MYWGECGAEHVACVRERNTLRCAECVVEISEGKNWLWLWPCLDLNIVKSELVEMSHFGFAMNFLVRSGFLYFVFHGLRKIWCQVWPHFGCVGVSSALNTLQSKTQWDSERRISRGHVVRDAILIVSTEKTENLLLRKFPSNTMPVRPSGKFSPGNKVKC